MKLVITITHHFILFFGIALLLTPSTFIRPYAQVKGVKTEKIFKPIASSANYEEVLHSEMLFRF